MGRKCCYNSYSCPPCYNPCCPPFFGPCCPPPCNPCAAFCNPCYDNFNCCCDSCSTKGNSYFVASSNDNVDISGQPSPYTVIFTEQQDCLCEYVNNTTFIPKCKGYYKVNTSVSVTNNGSSTASVTVAIAVNGIQRSVSGPTDITSGNSNVFSLSPNLYLCKGDVVYVTVSPTAGLSLGTRSFNGSKCGNNSCCKSSCCNNSCC